MNELRIPPHDEDAEKGIIGSILLDPDKIHGIELKPEEFYDRRNQLLWGEFLKLRDKSWDAILLASNLKDKGVLDKVGGFEYLSQLQDYAMVSDYSKQYADIVREKALCRKIIEDASEAIHMAYKGEEASKVADALSARLIVGVKEDLDIVSRMVKEMHDSRDGKLAAIPTPYEIINIFSGALRKRRKTVFTGVAGSGKSMFLAHWYVFLGKMGIPSMVVPLEDKQDVTLRRMASNHGNFDTSVFDGKRFSKYNGKWTKYDATDAEMLHAQESLEYVSNLPVFFYDKKCSIDDLTSAATRLKKTEDIQIMFIDGAKDLLRPSGKYNDVSFDEECSQRLCEIADELDISVVSVHHLTKMDGDRLITANDIRGSALNIGDARLAIALQSTGLSSIPGVVPNYDDMGNVTTRVLQIIKNNYGSHGYKVLESELGRCRFHEVEEQI